MKRFFISLIAICLPMAIWAQTVVPQGMNYQAVARDLQGEVISNQPVVLQVSLLADQAQGREVYREIHQLQTNEFGLFNLVIGEGRAIKGDFTLVPWSEAQIWMDLAIDIGIGFTTISTTRLLAVPYAFHAGSAETINYDVPAELRSSCGSGGINFWTIWGNRNIKDCHFIGTTNAQDVVFKSNNEVRMVITADGKIEMPGVDLTIGGNLDVEGDKVTVHHDLLVKENTEIKGDLDLEGKARFKQSLTVDNTSEGNTLSVSGESGNFIATFENKNDGVGDGIKIKLGKIRANNFLGNSTPNPDPRILTDPILELYKELITGNTNEKGEALAKLLACSNIQEQVDQARIAVGVGSYIVDYVNTNLPSTTEKTVLNETKLGDCAGVGDAKVCVGITIPAITIPALSFPTIPKIELKHLIPNIIEDPCFELDELDILSLETWGLQNIDLSISDLDDILDNNNEFVHFSDKDDRKMGSIRAESYENWADNYLNPIFLYKLHGSLNSTADKAHARYHFKSKLFEAIPSYLNLGVEYSSGNGDYAEWLERIDPEEAISTGDIVAVKGGKITKDLTGAEQIMAVSYRPIVLGNLPPEGKAFLGNNIAFMGQIPVKVMGPVETGDYIVADSGIPGYGLAIAPDDMKVEDLQLAVGRAWESNPNSGPKMVNTVIGVHNGDYVRILQRYEQRFQESEARLESLESKVDMLLEQTDMKNK